MQKAKPQRHCLLTEMVEWEARRAPPGPSVFCRRSLCIVLADMEDMHEKRVRRGDVCGRENFVRCQELARR